MRDSIPGEDEAGHGELAIGGGLLEVILGANAVVAATEQIGEDMGYAEERCRA